MRSVWSTRSSVEASPTTPKKVEVRLVTVVDGTQRVEAYDHVILACHSDAALELLRAGNVSPTEERLLKSFQWNRNEAVLHSDVKVSLSWRFLLWRRLPEARPHS